MLAYPAQPEEVVDVAGGRFRGDMYGEAAGPDDIRRAVWEQIRAGADFIKVMTTGARSDELKDPEPFQLSGPEYAGTVAEQAMLADPIGESGR
jgi:hypothetical protein